MQLQIAGGTVPGYDHTQPGQPGWKNNQDALHWSQTNGCMVAIVCDGCGSGEHSEVGSKIGAPLLTDILMDLGRKFVAQMRNQPDVDHKMPWDRVQTLFLSHIAVLASAMGGSFFRVIDDYFLFTVVGVLITPKFTFLFSVGDGVFILNGEEIKLGPFPGNEPPYLAYNLTGSSLKNTDPKLLKFAINRVIPTSELKSVILGSDGVEDLMAVADKQLPNQKDIVGPVQQFLLDMYFENPDAIRRRLALINLERAVAIGNGKARIIKGLLPDDTTIVVIKPSSQIQTPQQQEGL